LITDFGNKDWYVAEMKLMIRSLCDVEIVDITHEIDEFDIDKAKFLLLQANRIMPEHSVTIAVIDPGVGSDRKSIVLRSGNKYFIGPNNGIFDYITDIKSECFQIKEETFSEVSNTFHGRDIFAPLASKIICGENTDKYITPCECRGKGMKNPTVKDNLIIGQVIYIDKFGNAITNIDHTYYEDIKRGNIIFGEEKIEFVNSYSESSGRSAIFNSSGFLEITSYKGKYSENLKIGEVVQIEVRRHM